jgi:hydrogenase-4 component F
MIEALLVSVPAGLGIVCFFLRRRSATRFLLLAGAAAHAALTAWAWLDTAGGGISGGVWLGFDSLGLLFLSVTSLLFLVVSAYTVGFLAREGGDERADLEKGSRPDARPDARRAPPDRDEGFVFRNYPQGIFTGCLLLFLSSMSLVALSRHFGLLWVAIEMTTLVTATLIQYHRHHRSLEASWKYLLICSVGIALALLGTFFLAASAGSSGSAGSPGGAGLTIEGLAARAASLDPRWLRAAALLLVVGYGTKMGLVPMHTWLPDAHSEAPSAVSALLSGALLNCAFLGLLRLQGLLASAGLESFGREILLVLGFLSMAAAALFLIAQKDYKRLLAYSSVENMGILAVGIGLGGGGDWGALYHAVNHSLVKAALFLTAGNILLVTRSKSVEESRGLLSAAPASGLLWLAGFVAIAGLPPFGSFLSELAILRAAVTSGRYVAAGAFVVFLAAAFVGLALAFTRMAQGPSTREPVRESAVSVLPPLVLLACAAALGVVVPGFLDSVIGKAALLVGGAP